MQYTWHRSYMITVLSYECISVQSHNPQPPQQSEAGREGHKTQATSSSNGAQNPGSTEPGKPSAKIHHPPRRLQRKPPDRAPIGIGQRPPGNPGQHPTDPARPQPPRHGPRAGPRPHEPPNPPAEASPNTREGQAPQTAKHSGPVHARCAHRWVKPRAAGRGNAPPHPIGNSTSRPKGTASPRPWHHMNQVVLNIHCSGITRFLWRKTSCEVRGSEGASRYMRTCS